MSDSKTPSIATTNHVGDTVLGQVRTLPIASCDPTCDCILSICAFALFLTHGRRPELCGQRKHSTSVYAAPEIVKPVSDKTSYGAHFPTRPLPDDPRYVQDSSFVTTRHEGSPISCTVRLDGPVVRVFAYAPLHATCSLTHH